MNILEKAMEMERCGKSVIHLEVGEPGMEPPETAVSATIDALRKGFSRYTHSLGLWELREEIAHYYRKKYGVSVAPERVVVSSGSSPLLFAIVSSLVDPGDEVIVTDPGYPCYANIVEFLGGVARRVPLKKEDGFQLDVDKVRSIIDSRTKAIVVASPANPTGVTMDPSSMRKISELGIPVISDEIYHGLVYEGEERTFLEFMEDAIVINGFSKRFSMTGWRLGFAIVPEEFVPNVQKIQQNVIISASSFSQWGGIPVLKDETYVSRVREIFRRKRDFVLSLLSKYGLDPGYRPNGAFYVYMDLGEFTSDSYELSLSLLEKKGVAVTPGIDFGDSGKSFIRIAYTAPEDVLEEGVKRIAEFLEESC